MHDGRHDPAGDSPPQASREMSPYAVLLTKIEEVDAYSQIALQQYPRVERYALCSDIRQALTTIERLIIVAWKRYHKKTTLQDLDIEIEVLRMLLRKSVRLKYITPHRYETWSRQINEIGRMVGGWIRSVR
uniref:S23 ribosomal protein n=1 Tax=Desulfovibrio sp. U5L TaxID=596152 RepID=I2Q2M5_9BACT